MSTPSYPYRLRRIIVLAVFCLLCGCGLSAQAFSLLRPEFAAQIPGRQASGHTRSVLYRADSQAGKTIHALTRISGSESDIEVLGDIDLILRTAVSWRLGWDTTDTKSAERARAYLDRTLTGLKTWFSVCVPGKRPLEESRLDGLFFAWDMVSAVAPPDLTLLARSFFSAFENANLAPRSEYPWGTWTNCWQSNRVKRAALAAYALGDRGAMARAEAAFCQQISDNLSADGAPIDFTEHDSFAFAAYDLQALTIAALAAAAHGRDWYHWKDSRGVSLEKALLWLSKAAYLQGNHVEFLHSSVSSEREMAEAARASGTALWWTPVSARSLFWLAVRLDDRWLPFAARLGSDIDWLAIAWPTATPPEFTNPKVASPTNSGNHFSPSSSPPQTTVTSVAGAPVNGGLTQSQLGQLLGALKGGNTGGSAGTAQTPLSLKDALAGSLGSLGGSVDPDQ